MIELAAHAGSRVLGHAGTRAVATTGLALVDATQLWLTVAPDGASFWLTCYPGSRSISGIEEEEARDPQRG